MPGWIQYKLYIMEKQTFLITVTIMIIDGHVLSHLNSHFVFLKRCSFFFKDETCLLFITIILCGGVVSLALCFFLPVLFIAFV